MILVTVGTNGAAFDRVLSELDDVAPGEEVVIQRGPSELAPSGSFCVDYLPFAEVDRLVRSARVVVTHAGVGSVLVALAAGHRPLVVPRLRAHGEVVDDHQLLFAERLDRDGLVRCITDPSDLRAAIAEGSTRRAAGGRHDEETSLVADLSTYIASKCSVGERAPIARVAASSRR